jgi:bifunctional N-acetylglucosamine-1-phosphate-uridyltransferase/glucosamine-1-phosphate-acetyltransferase GlmU-like protein
MTTGRGTAERNFLPFLAWADSRGERVVTFPATDPREAIGVNDANDLARVEDYLRSRG